MLRKTLLWRPTETMEPAKAGFFRVFRGAESRLLPALAGTGSFGQKRPILPKVGAEPCEGAQRAPEGAFLDEKEGS